MSNSGLLSIQFTTSARINFHQLKIPRKMVNTSQQNLVQTVQLRIFFFCGLLLCSPGNLVQDIQCQSHHRRQEFLVKYQLPWHLRTKFVSQNPSLKKHPPISPSISVVVLVIATIMITDSFTFSGFIIIVH